MGKFAKKYIIYGILFILIKEIILKYKEIKSVLLI